MSLEIENTMFEKEAVVRFFFISFPYAEKSAERIADAADFGRRQPVAGIVIKM